MTGAEWALFGAVILYLLTLAPVKAFGHRDFDNSRPRDPAFYAKPLRARAHGAHVNGIETFPFFAAAVLLAEFRACPQHIVDLLAFAFLAIRFCFVLAYLLDRPTIRTLLWNAGFAVNAGLFFLPAFTHA
ncbi:MAG TPA: MAPEG family protein [Allosphingosinicella sp.]|nr:MAPEG family protein [Allosphingosinicella sp.]